MKTTQVVTALGALAQDTRLAVFRALVRAHLPAENQGGLAAGDIGEALNVAPATLSFHLKELANAGLVHARRQGRSIVYKADIAAMRRLMDFLLEDCCQGACGASGMVDTTDEAA